MNQGNILVVEDTLASLKLITDILTEEGYQVSPADSGELALASVAVRLPELILLDVRMPGMDGFEVLRRIKAQERSRNIPVILLTALAEIENRVEGFKLGAVDFISKPFQREELLARIQTHIELFRLRLKLELQAEELKHALEQLEMATSIERQLSDKALRESEARYRRLTEELTDYQYTVRIENGRAVGTKQSPACAIVTGYTPEEFFANPNLWIQMVVPEDRERIMAQIQNIMAGNNPLPIEHQITRKDGKTRWVCDTIILNKDETGKLVSYDGVIKDITELKAAESKVSFLAYHDNLTELPNRELFYDRMSHAISQARRNRYHLALLFLDLDGFKAVNDHYGHEAGDVVLKVVATRLQACVRDEDTVARLGGDEFTLILSEVEKPTDVAGIAEKIIQKLGEPVLLGNGRKCNVGVSIGIAIYPEDGHELDKLMSAADSAMYQSKAGGKNTYTFFKENTDKSTDTHPWLILDSAHLINIPAIDLEHQQLISMINRLNDAVNQYVSAEVAIRIFDEMISYTHFHFTSEERLMDQYGYAEKEAHKQRHQRLIGEVNYLRGKFIKGGELLVLQYIKDWFLSHIADMDQPFGGFLKQQGINPGNSDCPQTQQLTQDQA